MNRTETRTMSQHRVYIERIFAEELLNLPENVYITGASWADGGLVLEVLAEDDLGADEVTAMYGNIEEDETRIHFGMFEPKEG